MLRSQIINTLINRYKFESYLEIGTRKRSDNFNLINVKNKTCIDPNPSAFADFVLTSDDWFKYYSDKKFDLIFIDGLHKSFQVERDIDNALSCLNAGGVIVLHDCNPTSYEMQIRDVDVIDEWTGDVWKAYVKYRKTSPYFTCVVDTDYGCGIIDTNKNALSNNICDLMDTQSFECMNYAELDLNRREILNLITVENFLNLY